MTTNIYQDTQGIPGLPDLTHPDELMIFGTKLLSSFLTLTLLVIALGIVIALINFSLRRNESDWSKFSGKWTVRYSTLLNAFGHGVLILIIVVVGFFFCSTLANRYHYWEQAKVTEVTASVSGTRLEQAAPRVRYLVEEPYSYYTQVNDKRVLVEDTRKVSRFLALSNSDIQVTIDQIRNLQTERNNYTIDFSGRYEVTNSLPQAKELLFEVSPPYGYSLLQNLRVEQEGKRLQPSNPGNYSFPHISRIWSV